jgi:hypothetical protein
MALASAASARAQSNVDAPAQHVADQGDRSARRGRAALPRRAPMGRRRLARLASLLRTGDGAGRAGALFFQCSTSDKQNGISTTSKFVSLCLLLPPFCRLSEGDLEITPHGKKNAQDL